MTGLALALDAFHFLRPWWLLALIPTALLWWHVRRSRVVRDQPVAKLAPHLRAALTINGSEQRRIQPIDAVALALVLLTIGTAGPTWSRQTDPFVAQATPLAIALKVTPSMDDTDIAPSRLERAKQKIRDLLELRGGARTALVAYAGSAHGVVPMTEDPGVMTPYLEGLAPDVMPKEGDRAADALALAEMMLSRDDTGGAILFVADGLDPSDAPALAASATPFAVLAMLPEGADDRGFDALPAGKVVRVRPDDGDIRQIDRMLNAAYRQALLEDSDQPWRDRGPWFAWPAALIILLWFRRGWTMRWAGLVLVYLLVHLPQGAHAEGFADWFLTPDQQGRIAFERKNFGGAADRFVDPLWRGYALYRDGQYAEAITVLSRVETAEAAFIAGMAAIKNRAYRDGVRAFETALARDPDYPNAADNLAVAKEIVTYIERVREQSDTGEEAGIGADEVVFDNEASRGADTTLAQSEDGGPALLTTEQWMNTVDTRTGDFLRQRFAIEAARQGSGGAPSDAAEP